MSVRDGIARLGGGGEGLGWIGVALFAAAGFACGSRSSIDPGWEPHGQFSTAPTANTMTASVDSGAGECEARVVGATRSTWTVPVSPAENSLLEDVYAVAAADDGGVFAAGCGVPGGAGGCRRGSGACFLLKLDEGGRVVFEQRFTDGINDPLTVALRADREGGVLVALEDDEGTDLVAGAAPGCLVARLDGEGVPKFVRHVDGADCTRSFAFAADEIGRSALAAASIDGPGFLVVRLDEVGSLLSARTIVGDPASSRIAAAALQRDGTLLVAGYGAGSFDFGRGARDLGATGSLFLATYDDSLAPKDFLAVPDQGIELQAAATPDGQGFVLAGDLDRSGVNLGGGALPYSGDGFGAPNRDVFLARLTTGLGHVFSHSYGDGTSQSSNALCLDPDGTIGWAGAAGKGDRLGGSELPGSAPGAAQAGFLATISPDGTTGATVLTQASLHGIACRPASYVLVGRVTDSPADPGAGEAVPGGFIVRRTRP